MIIYNITTKIDSDLEEDWLNWMKSEHIPDVMATNLFKSYKVCRIIGGSNKDGVAYATQFTCDSLSIMHKYEVEHAPGLRAKTQQRYQDKAVSFRTLMEVVH